MHPVKRFLIVVLAMFVFGIFGLIYITLEFTERDRAFANLETPVSLAEYSVELGGENNYVFIDDFESFGEPVTYARDSASKEAAFHYLPVRTTTLGNDGAIGDDVFILYCRNGDADIDQLAAGTTFKGTLRQPNLGKEELSEFQLAIQAEYLELDPRDAAMVWLHTPTDSSTHYVLWGVWGYLAVAIAVTIGWFWRYMKKEQCWLERSEAFERAGIKGYPKAVRLIHGDPTLSPSSLPPRSIDPIFDVPFETKKKHPKERIWAWRIMAGGVSVGIAVAAQVGLVYLNADWATGIFPKIGFGAIFAFGQVFLQLGIASINRSRHESPIQKKKASHRQTAFHEYHDKVLKALGFRDIGDYRHVCATGPGRTRTIYLSPKGNTLVEVSMQFFSIETLTNDGKYLETHSLVSKASEKLDLNARHLLHSIDHEDILRAFEEHDDFVAERTFGGSVLEAQFTEERFERFIAWVDYKANDPQVLQESLIAS